MGAEAEQPLRERVALGCHHSALACRHRFDRVEGERGHVGAAGTADRPSCTVAPEGVAAVLDHDHVVGRFERVEIDRQAGEADRDDALDVLLGGLLGRGRDVDVPGLSVDVDEPRPRADVEGAVG